MDTTQNMPNYRPETVPAATFATSLDSFEATARNVRRGFKVAMAVNVFGVGTLLANDLPKNSKVREKR
jgi:hypothetical protein